MSRWNRKRLSRKEFILSSDFDESFNITNEFTKNIEPLNVDEHRLYQRASGYLEWLYPRMFKDEKILAVGLSKHVSQKNYYFVEANIARDAVQTTGYLVFTNFRLIHIGIEMKVKRYRQTMNLDSWFIDSVRSVASYNMANKDDVVYKKGFLSKKIELKSPGGFYDRWDLVSYPNKKIHTLFIKRKEFFENRKTENN